MRDEAVRLAEVLRPMIRDDRVLAAIATVPREHFVPRRDRRRAYANIALPIGCGQTISQPLVVARMLELLALKPSDRVLDIGTGSGYHAALLACLSAKVWSIERHQRLSDAARVALDAVGVTNVELIVSDGTQGLAEHAPFDAINVAAAAAADVPAALIAQLAPGGRMIVPVGGGAQHLVLLTWDGERIERRRCDPVRFVPLVRG